MERSLAEIARDSDTTVRSARREFKGAVLRAHEAGSSQRAIAELVGRSQPEVARLLARSRGRRDRRWSTAAEFACAIDDEAENGDDDFALRLVRQMLDTFRGLDASQRRQFLAEAPLMRSRRWGTLVRAAVSWACRETGHRAPAWAGPVALEQMWFVRPDPALLGRLIQGTPGELAVVGIWLDADSLRGV